MGGIVKSVKKVVSGVGDTARKIIPNEVADVAVKAAPFVAPFNPLLAGGMAALGSYDQTGSFGRALKSGLFTYGGGQLARGIGGAGFQRGFNPFSGLPSGSFGIGSLQLGGSPIGTETGLKLGQYEMFGGPGREEFLKSQEIGKAIQTDAARTARLQDLDTFDSIEAFKTAQADPKLAQIKLDADKVIENIYGQDQKTGYGNLFKKVVEPSATLGERTAAIKELGGKALKDIYTTDTGKIDKFAVGATIAGATSYMEAKKLAEEAGLVEEADQYTEEMYEADKARYDDYYKEILPDEAFGLKDGGRVKLEDGGIPSIMLEKKDYNFMDLIDEDAEEEYYKKKAEELDRKYNPQNYNDIIPKEKPMDQYMLNEIMGDKGMNTLSEEARDDAMKMYAERAYKKGQISEDEYREIMGFKVGGRVGYKDAGFTTVEDLGIEREEIEPKFQYDLKDLDIERDKSKVLVMDEDGSTKIMDKEIAETLGLKIIADSFDTELMKKAKGGRVSRRFGSSDDGEKGIMSITMKTEDDDKKLTGIETLQDEDRLAVFPKDVFSANEISRLFSDKSLTTNMERKQLYKILMNPGQFPDAEMGLKKLLGRPIEEFKKGGRVQYAMGSEVPIRENQAGVSEMDFRQTGGFVPPIGVKEKADDIPAMLSNNEFVFTADAVRAAGGGSVNKGAKRMYNLMKSLEGKVV